MQSGWVRGLVTLLTAATLVASAAPAFAQSAKDLAAARRLFADALKEEEHGRFEPALEKYKRVQAVRDTVPVRYRIGTSLEGMGRLKDALASFHAAIDMAGTDVAQEDVVRASEERIAELDRRLPQLLLIVTDRAPPDLVVEVDHERVSENALRTPLVLDPGSHDVHATAEGVPPFHTQVALTDGAHVSLTIPIERAAISASIVPVRSPRGTNGSRSDGVRTAGVVAIVAGGALLAGSIAALILRQTDIGTLRDACTGNVCPDSRREELSSTRSRAVTEGTTAAILGIAGLASIGGGSALLLLAGPIRVAAAPARGGAQVYLTASLP